MRSFCFPWILLFSVLPVLAEEVVIDPNATEPPPGAIWLDSLDIKLTVQDMGQARATWATNKNRLTINGTVFKHGVGTHAHSEMELRLDGSVKRFVSMAGVDDSAGEAGSVVFQVWSDGHRIYESPVIRGGDRPQFVSVDLSGVKRLQLIVEDAGDGIENDVADWAGAYLVLDPASDAKPRVIAPTSDEPTMPIADREHDAPRINYPRIVGTTPGRPFIFRIPASGEGPLTFTAENLPTGLDLDRDTGIITGSLAKTGEHDVQLTVMGPKGTDRNVLRIVGGEHKLALTPPMGWNSWNVWACAVDDAKVRAAADAMISTGLADYGYQYINIDDCWEGQRNDAGEIQPNEKFPDMAALGDYIHSKGLKFGIYSSPGPTTCAQYLGSYGHEQQDVKTWSSWGVDYLKYDWCGYWDIAKGDESLPTLQKPYRLMRECLDRADRDIVYSLCQYGMGDVWTWGADVGGNLWRTTGDISDFWSLMSYIGFAQSDKAKYAGPGHWNDPDMLVVGKLGWGPNIRDTRLTRNEQITHISLWSLLAAPMLLGCDMAQLDKFTLNLLCNDEVIAVNQDPLGKAATRRAADGKLEVWARPLEDGTMAVGLFNRGRGLQKITVQWSDIGLSGKQPVRDLWLKKDVGAFSDSYTHEVRGHAAAMVKIGKAKP